MNNAALNLATAPRISVPSIASSAMLVELSISVWTGIKKDKRASQDVEAQNGADTGVAKVSKKLLGDCAELKAVQDFTANVRTGIHYAMTMPWSNSGLRLLPTVKYFDYTKTMTALQSNGCGWLKSSLPRMIGKLHRLRPSLALCLHVTSIRPWRNCARSSGSASTTSRCRRLVTGVWICKPKRVMCWPHTMRSSTQSKHIVPLWQRGL